MAFIQVHTLVLVPPRLQSNHLERSEETATNVSTVRQSVTELTYCLLPSS